MSSTDVADARPVGARAAAPTRRRGRPASLTRQQVISTALDLARVEGLEAVSMRSVADLLGVHQTSLYTYVVSKDDLLQGMLDTAFATRLALPGADDPRAPADQLRAVMDDLRELALEHVELLALLGRHPATTVGQRQALECIMGLLARLGLTPTQQGQFYGLLHHVTVASALLTGNHRLGGAEMGDRLPLLPNVDPSEYPRLAEVVVSHRVATTYDEVYEGLLTLVLEQAVPAMVDDNRRPDSAVAP